MRPKGPAPRLGTHPDLSGYWVPSHAPADKPVGNLGKDYPGYTLPFTPEGEKAHKFNVEHTIDPEALCIVGGLPRHNASGLPFQLLQGQDHAVFLYWYTTYRLVPFDRRKHSDDPDPSFFGEEIGSWDGDAFGIDSIGFKQERTWADENADPYSDRQHVTERWTRPDIGHLHVEMVVNDPLFYKEPIHYQRTWLLGKPGDEVREYSCSEDNVDLPHLQPGPGIIGPDGQRGFDKLAPLPPPPSKDHPAVTSDEETLTAQRRPRIVEGAVDGSPEEIEAEKRELAAFEHRRNPIDMDGSIRKVALTPLPPRPTPEHPATTSLIPQ